ncbi:hypothetical protein G4B88_030734 [Cannabis sativa]|uniref:Uncharacterized protein n=1 Tax=Cannabis sativa TaxID=3483 RepID=A0A7J6H8G9_CANSA|nr:hypothetical protein G4B88_030734 [Cannabis sativa]
MCIEMVKMAIDFVIVVAEAVEIVIHQNSSPSSSSSRNSALQSFQSAAFFELGLLGSSGCFDAEFAFLSLKSLAASSLATSFVISVLNPRWEVHFLPRGRTDSSSVALIDGLEVMDEVSSSVPASGVDVLPPCVTPVARSRALLPGRRLSLMRRGTVSDRWVWRPKVAESAGKIFAKSSVDSLSTPLELGKIPDIVPIIEPISNFHGEGDIIGRDDVNYLVDSVNPCSSIGPVSQLACVVIELVRKGTTGPQAAPNYFFLYGPNCKICAFGPNVEARVSPCHVMGHKISKDIFDVGPRHNINGSDLCGSCDSVGLNKLRKGKSVIIKSKDKSRVSCGPFECHMSLKIGPSSLGLLDLLEQSKNSSTLRQEIIFQQDEPLDSDEVAKQGSSKTSANVSLQVSMPVSLGQSSKLTAWKAKARLNSLIFWGIFLKTRPRGLWKA